MPFVAIAYDISAQRRRTRVHTLLLAHGEPVQESLFECDLDEPALRALRRQLGRLLHPDDKVRIYPLCADCVQGIDDGRGNRWPISPKAWVV